MCKGLRKRAPSGLAGHSSREASTPSVNLPGEATQTLPSTPFGEAAAAYRHAHGALLSGGIHTLRQPPWRGIHILPSTPSWRPPQPTVMPAEGDLCVTPPVGDSVAEMASIPSGEPPTLDSRLRGNDGCAKGSPCAGMTVVQRSRRRASSGQPLGALLSGGSNPFGEATTAYRHAREAPVVWRCTPLAQPLRGGRHSLPSCPRKRASSGLAGHSSREASTPSINLPGESSIFLPSTPSARPPQSTVMPAKAGIQGSGGALYSEASIPSVKLSLRDALIHYRNFMNHSVRKVLTKHERRF